MNKITLILLIVVALAGCKKEAKDEIIKTVIAADDGEKMECIFNNTKNTATIIFQNDTIQLDDMQPASGIWYEKDGYELRGKGTDVALSKNGKVIFQSKKEE